jgi:hypothetical protein
MRFQNNCRVMPAQENARPPDSDYFLRLTVRDFASGEAANALVRQSRFGFFKFVRV